MQLNTLKPAPGSHRRHVRVGRGIGSGLGKTCGRGVKGSGARKSPNHRPGFEGGQMPLKIRLPKFGFHSPRKALTAEVSLNALQRIESGAIDRQALLDAGLITRRIRYVKIVLPHEPKLGRSLEVRGLGVTRGARAAIEAAGGSVETAEYTQAAARRRELSARRRALKLKTLKDKLAAAGDVRPARRERSNKGGHTAGSTQKSPARPAAKGGKGKKK